MPEKYVWDALTVLHQVSTCAPHQPMWVLVAYRWQAEVGGPYKYEAETYPVVALLTTIEQRWSKPAHFPKPDAHPINARQLDAAGYNADDMEVETDVLFVHEEFGLVGARFLRREGNCLIRICVGNKPDAVDGQSLVEQYCRLDERRVDK